MNAVVDLLAALPREVVGAWSRRLFGELGGELATSELREMLQERFELDLAGFLNCATRLELELMATARKLETSGLIGELRARIWCDGATAEAGGWVVEARLQPVPIVLRGKLVYLLQGEGLAPPAERFPRRVGPAVAAPAVGPEPETVEELLDNANRIIGVRLGQRGRDKGAFGLKVAALLGVEESGFAEPDWRGEVEIKTVPVVVDRSGYWRVKEDPAVTMVGQSPRAKLRQALWIARVAQGDSPILSWYYQEWSPAVADLAANHLHTRPKGGANTTGRGWYLHKQFFVESGFLHSLNIGGDEDGDR